MSMLQDELLYRRRADQSRAAYCVMVCLSLLNLPLELPDSSPGRVKGNETFLTGLAEWISRCECCLPLLGVSANHCPGQTYEGGISDSPDHEAHGAYVFCALACLCIIGEPQEVLPKCVLELLPIFLLHHADMASDILTYQHS